jgi:hypothetical protein
VLDLKKSGPGVGITNHGFPFTHYSTHCYGWTYYWDALIGNILTAAVLSFVIGLAATHFWLKFSSPEFRAKWHF